MNNVIVLPVLPESRVFILDDIINLQTVQDRGYVVMARSGLTFNCEHYDVGVGESEQQIQTNSFYTIPMFSVRGEKLPVAEIMEELFALSQMPLWVFTRSNERISLLNILQSQEQEYQVHPHSYRVSSQQRILDQLTTDKKEIFKNMVSRTVDDYATLRREPGTASSYL